MSPSIDDGKSQGRGDGNTRSASIATSINPLKGLHILYVWVVSKPMVDLGNTVNVVWIVHGSKGGMSGRKVNMLT
jgi:hypothetical protein